MTAKRAGGFSLIEMMITVVVLFLIGSIAIPAYTGYMDTSRRQAVVTTIEQFTMFQDNFRIDNGTYVAGTYAPGGVNTFDATLGYRTSNENNRVSFTVAAGSCGNIANCYRVTATDGEVTGTWDSVARTWVWPE